jgi:glycosyltransferase involved in cell wall biosynthesis
MSKILCISNFGNMVGGGEYSFLDLATNLSGRCKTIVALPSGGDLSRVFIDANIETKIIPLPSIRPWNLFLIIKALYAYYKICITKNISIIYANGTRPAFFSGIVGRITGTPVVWHCRICQTNPITDRILSLLVSKIIANSNATAARFANYLTDKIQVIYNGIDLSKYKSAIYKKPDIVKANWRVILMVARASRTKRHDVAISAFEKLAEKHANAHLVCIGDRDAHDQSWWLHLQSLSRKSSFSDRIHWLGDVKDVRAWYQYAEVMLMPAEKESFGRVIVEAMASGLPVVASNDGGIPEIFNNGEEGFLVKPGDADELCSKLCLLLCDHELRDSYAIASQKRAEFFSIEKHVNTIQTTFKNLLGLS